MKIVQLSDGKYALRRWSILYFRWMYLDLKHGYWWAKGDFHFPYCCTLDLEVIKKHLPKTTKELS